MTDCQLNLELGILHAMKKPSRPIPDKGSMRALPIDSFVERRPKRISDENPAAVKTRAVRKAQTEHSLQSSNRTDRPWKKDVLDILSTLETSDILTELEGRFSKLSDPAILRSQSLIDQIEKRENISPFHKKEVVRKEEIEPSQDEINLAITALLDHLNVKAEARVHSIAEYFNFLTGKKLDILPFQVDVIIADDVPRWADSKGSGISPRTFIETAYKDYLGRGLTQADIRKYDKELYRDLHNWLRKKENTLDGLQLPTKAEARRKQLEGKSPEQLRALRGLANSAAYLR